ncbi:hypothetical protein ABNF65_12875 [Paenibacillus larvae]
MIDPILTEQAIMNRYSIFAVIIAYFALISLMIAVFKWMKGRGKDD